jgi:hypothetical protein
MIRLNVGLSRKVGLPSYGSKGGSVNLEIELADLDHQKLRETIHKLFGLAKQSLEDELGQEEGEVQAKPVVQVSVQPAGKTLQEAVTEHGKLLSEKQHRYLETLARTQRRNLQKECEEEFGKKPLALTSKEASALIEKWRNSLVSAR